MQAVNCRSLRQRTSQIDRATATASETSVMCSHFQTYEAGGYSESRPRCDFDLYPLTLLPSVICNQ